MFELIMCIDDDPITMMLCKKVITKSLFSNEIISAQNGEVALQHFNELKYLSKGKGFKSPQLIFLDLNMPVMGGWEFLDHFNTAEYSDFNSIKIIVLSSTIDPEDLERARTYPMVIDFLSKPISIAMLEYVKNKLE